MKDLLCRVYKTNPSLISSIKMHKNAQCHFHSFPVQPIDSKLTSANPAPLQSRALRFDNHHGALRFLWQLATETLTFEYVLKTTH